MKYPEHDKIEALKKKGIDTQEYGYFLEWLKNKYSLCKYWNEIESYLPEHTDVNLILAEYFEIDYNKLMEEKEQILEEFRQTQ